jgi:tRNA (guanine37-N1)-methyltransferase
VPEVLLSGNHLEIERWRRQQRLSLTLRLRPELITRARDGGGLSPEDEAFLAVIG